MKYFFIINPKAGKRHGDIPALIKRHAVGKKGNLEIAFTERAGHAAELSYEAVRQGYGSIIAAGGDGTIQETARGIMKAASGIDLSGINTDVSLDKCRAAGINFGILPCGSGNGLARNMRIPLDIDKAAEGIFKWRSSPADAGVANGRLFLVSCGAGLDAEIAHCFNSQSHGRGILPYVWHALHLYFTYRPILFKAEIDGETKNLQKLILTSLIGEQYGGGAKIAPLAVSDDGYLDLCLVRPISTIRLLVNLYSLFDGTIYKNKDWYEDIRCRSFSLKSEKPFWYHLDGEDFYSESGMLNVNILPGAFEIIRP